MERYRKQKDANIRPRGDTVKAIGITGRRVTLSPVRSVGLRAISNQSGFTLIELVMTITIMTILTLGVMPLVRRHGRIAGELAAEINALPPIDEAVGVLEKIAGYVPRARAAA